MTADSTPRRASARLTKAECSALFRVAHAALAAFEEDQTYEIVKDTEGQKAADAYYAALGRAATKLGARI